MKKIYVCLLLLILAACSEENIVINQPEDQVIKTNSMAKILNAYGSHTAAMIKERAEIPLQADMVINGTTVECYNIDSDQVAYVLGETDSSLAGLCTSPKVNKGANFRPLGTPPYSLDDFAGYNHNAYPVIFWYSFQNVLDATYVGGGIPVTLVLAKGERAPEKDNPNCSWDRIRLELTLSGGLTASLVDNLAMTGTYLSGSLTNAEFTIPIASNDYYNAIGVIRGFYTDPWGEKVSEIADLYKTFTIKVVPTFTLINIDTAIGATPASYMLYYRLTSGGAWTRAQNAFSLKFDPNISTPDKGSWQPPFSVYSDFFIIYKLNSSYIQVNVAKVTHGLELKINNEWFRYSVTGGGLAFDVISTGDAGPGYPTIDQYGNLNWSSLTY